MEVLNNSSSNYQRIVLAKRGFAKIHNINSLPISVLATHPWVAGIAR